MKGQLDALTVDKQSAEDKRDQLKAKLDDYDRRLAREPAVERDYRELARELETAQHKYEELRAKQGDVQVSENLETRAQGRALHDDRAAVAARKARLPQPLPDPGGAASY